MRGWLKRALLLALVCGAAWGGAIWYWRAAGRTPDTAELLLLLVALPLAVLALLWLGRALAGLLLAAPAVALAAPQAAAPAAAAPAVLPGLAIVAGALRSAHGAAPAELAAALKQQKAQPALDPELFDDDGYPQMSVRATLADAADDGKALREQVGIWLALNGHAGVAFDDEQWRALALAADVAGELGERAAAHAGLPFAAKDAGAPVLQLLPLWPEHWQAVQRAAAGAWLSQRTAAGGWPAERIALPAYAAAPDLPLPHAGAVFTGLAQQAADARTPLLAIVLAGASHIGSASIGDWSAKGTIFSARHPQGMIPGEGAAGLLLADAAQALLLGAGPHALLHSADARRDASADGARRADPTMLQALAAQVLAQGGAGAGQVAMLVADTGHRSGRTMELMSLAGAALPQLDAGEDVLRVGGACGSCGEAAFMTALVVGAHHAAELSAPVLCIGNEDPFRRSAALIRPAAAAP